MEGKLNYHRIWARIYFEQIIYSITLLASMTTHKSITIIYIKTIHGWI